MMTSLGCARTFSVEEKECATIFFNYMGQREDVTSCLKYYDAENKCYVVEWTFSKKEKN